MSDVAPRLAAALADRYNIERELGRGGAATVYLAADLKHGRKVAIKVLHPELAATLGAERFLHEVQITAQLQHPHVLTLIDSGDADGLLYYVMPYVEGESLRTRIAREGELPIDDVLRLTRDVVDGLAHAHARGLVHRDIKPENVLLTGRHAIVTDFGIAKAMKEAAGMHGMTTAGVSLGTPAYMAPEQVAADPHVDHRADIYSVGIMAYEMLAGRPPFTGASAQAVFAAHMAQTPTEIAALRNTVPPALGALIMRCLEKRPADRPQRAEDLLHQFDSLVTSTSGFTRSAGSSASHASALGGSSGGTGRGSSDGDGGGDGGTGGAINQRVNSPRWKTAAAALTVALALASTLWYANNRPSGSAFASVPAIAVLPFVPASNDTALARLGRDLVVTLSTNLDGTGPIRTIDALTVLAQVQADAAPLSLQGAVALGQKLGAANVVQGSLVRVGALVRLDVGLFETAGGDPVARATVLASPDDLIALTDSTTWALLSALWRGPDAPTPSLGAVTTRSLPALRAFLAGEQAILENDWSQASQSFASAIQADSSFWWAYCRYRYARGWRLQAATAEGTVCRAHHDSLPEKERLMQVALYPAPGTTDTEALRIRNLEIVTQRFPDYWPGWFTFGDRIMHYSIPTGRTLEESRKALERATTLNPRLVPAFQHLAWIAAAKRDTASLRIALDTIRALNGFEPGEAAFLRTVQDLVHGRPPPSSALDSAAASALQLWRDGLAAELTNGDYLHYGFPAAEIAVSRRILREPALTPAFAAIHERGIVWSFVARGAWDSALVAAETFAQRDTTWSRQTEAYRIAVLGVLFGAVHDSIAAARRPASAAASARAPQARSRARQFYLDGLLAYARSDSAGIAAARAAAAEYKDSVDVDQVFEAFEMERRGDVRGAVALLHEQDLRSANRRYPSSSIANESTFPAVHRILQSRWYGMIGDTTRAVEVLNYFDTMSTGSGFDAAAMLASLARLQRAKLAEGQGRCEQAKADFEEFRRRYDLPVANHKHLVTDADAALERMRTGEPRCTKPPA